MKYKLGIFGLGVMGTAILSRVVADKKLNKDQIALFDIDRSKYTQFDGGYKLCQNPQEIADECEIVLFSVKPQHFHSITDNVTFSDKNTILSIMAGVSVDTLRSNLNYPCPIIRVMPNTPCKLGKGVCGVYFDGVSEENKSLAKDWLSSCGDVVELQENLFDAVTSVSGSGPAYVYMFIDAMIRGGMEGGLTFEQSKKLTIATMIGTAEMVKNTDEDIQILIERVCSKGGTTIEAVKRYRENNLDKIIIDGINACRERSVELGKGANH